MGRRKIFSCDFETTVNINDCRVWGYAIKEIGNNSDTIYGNNIDDFMKWCEEEKGTLYFHNLKFDGEFIVNWLLRNNYEYSKNGLKNTFNTIISSMGNWYAIDICYGYNGKKKLHTVIYDSYKKLPFTVDKIGKDFNLDVLKIEKEEEFYKRERNIDHVLTDEEISYMNNDVNVISNALNIQFNEGLTKITNGSDALKSFKDTIGGKKFDKLFPIYSLELNEDIRKAYRGGFTWLNKKYQEKKINEGLIFDVNSLYPSVMYYNELPCGFPIYYDGKYKDDKNYPLFIQHIKCEFVLKENKIPCIQLKHNNIFKANEYLERSDGEIVDLYVTNIDLSLIKEHYHIYNEEYCGGWKFRSVKGVFNHYIEKWMSVKTSPHSSEAQVILAKLMLNSLYGKFATNPNITGKVPYLKDDGSTGFKKGDEEYRDPIYTPMGVFITSYARELTIRTAQKCYKRIIYCDTDSIHLEGLEIPKAINDIIHDKKLGYWAHETTFIKALYLRQKTYMFEYFNKKENKNITVVKCAGMTDKIKKEVNFNNFKVGFSRNGKKRPIHVKGGIVLEDSVFTIKG